MCYLSCISLLCYMFIEYYLRKCKSQMLVFLGYCFVTINVYYFFEDIFVNFSSEFDFFFAVFICGLYISYLMFIYMIKRFRIKTRMIFRTFNYKAYFIMVMIFSYYELARGVYYVNVLSYDGLRMLINADQLSLHSGITSAFVASLVYMEYEFYNKKITRIFAVFTLFALAILSTSKIFIILSVIYSVPWYAKWYHVGIKQIIYMLSLIISLFMLSHFLLGKVAGSSDDTNILFSLMYTLLGYYLGGLASFQLFLDGIVSLDPGWVRTGAWVGNVHSAFMPLFAEKEYLILLLRVFIIGFFYSFVTINSSSIKFLKIYGWLALLMIFYANMFGASQLICFLVAAIFINVFSNNFYNKLDNKNIN